MKRLIHTITLCVFTFFLCQGILKSEIADAVYRDHLEFAGLNVNWHTALTFRYDNGAKTRYVIEADSDYVKITDDWGTFLGTTGGTFQKQACPANLSFGLRQNAIQFATAQAGTPYWNYYFAIAAGYATDPLGAYEDPSWITPGVGFRCDGLVEWVYEQIGYNPCVDAQLYNNYGVGAFYWPACGPQFQASQIPQAVQTPPSSVVMTYPSSTDVLNPTVSSSQNITLQASASDSNSGLSFNKPFDYYYEKYVNGSWSGWVYYGSNSGTQPVTILTANTWYAWRVEAFDNDSNSNSSTIYYFEWVPVITYTITASAGSGGTISPNGSFSKNAGDSQAFTASPNANYVVNQWTVDAVVVQYGGTSYTLSNIQAAHNVQATFAYVPPQYTITASAGSGGTISPNGSFSKTAGDSQGFTAFQNANYVVNQWTVDSVVVQYGGTSYTLSNIQAAHNVQVTFTYAPPQYTITASAGSGGTISPNGSFSKTAGDSQTFTATPNANYVVNQWTVDSSVAQSGGTSYTLANIQAGHSVQVTFTYAPTQYTINASAGSGGSISPSGSFAESVGSSQTFTAYPNANYAVNQWLLDSVVTQTGGTSYTLNNIQSGHNVQVTFVQGVSVTVQGNPSGVSFSVDGTTYSTPQTFSWVSGSSHPIGTTSPQSGGTGVQYIWSNWSDAGAVSHNVAPTSGTTFTANFSTQYRLDTSVSPAGGGTVAVNPPGTWFPPSQGLQLTASPASGYAFSSWAGVDSSSGNGASVTMNGYRSVTANFAVVSSAYTFITLAGSANAGSQNGAGGAAGFNFETGTASDKVGNVYVADTYNSTIRKISPAGMVTTIAGLAGNPGSANGIGSAARFLWPNGVGAQENGTVYVADTYNNTIRKITSDGSVSTLAGTAGIAGFADGSSGVARFNQPGAVAVDSNGVLYVADGGNNSIRKITPGGLVSTLAGWTNAGYADGIGTNSLLNGPAGITVDANGNVFVADTGNNTIRKIATNGMVSTLAGLAGSAGHADGVSTNAQFNGPTGVAVDAAGNVFVADTYNYTIRRIGTDGTVTTIAGMSGQYGYQDGTGTNALFDFASGIAVDGRGDVYVADTDNNVIRKGWWAGTPTAVILQSPKMNGAQVKLDFTVLTGPSSGFTLLSADQAGGPWGSDATGVLTTNVIGVSYSFTTWPGVSTKFYRIRSP